MPTYKERFLALANEMEALAAGLNTHATECSGCKAKRFDSYEEELAARKLLGYADSFAKLAESRKDGAPAAFLSREAPTDAVGAKWDTLWARMDAGGDMLPIARSVAGLINENLQVHPRAARVLARLNPWLRENDVSVRRTLDVIERERSG